MAEQAVERMGVDQFLAWSLDKADRYELVDGTPHMMARAKRRHDRVVTNVLFLLRGQLSGKTCEPFGADTAVVIPNGNVRLPDAGVDCGQADDDDLKARDPRLVVEVLSPPTRDFDMFGKLDEYKTVPSLTYIVLVDPDAPQATVWSRRGAEWSFETVRGLEAALSLPALGLVLPLAELYDRVAFQPRPRLVT
jgi:Uma2 family endonuclease